ncbi:MAG: restriction endonuclease [Synergistaceae bacterium]|nr:restriction endonuclease [Synergistaceae bacterium]
MTRYKKIVNRLKSELWRLKLKLNLEKTNDLIPILNTTIESIYIATQTLENVQTEMTALYEENKKLKEKLESLQKKTLAVPPLRFPNSNEIEKYPKQLGDAELDKWFEGCLQDDKEKGYLYERYIGYVLEKLEYDVNYVGLKKRDKNGDGGIDIIAKDNECVWIIQCKNYTKTVPTDEVREHLGVITIYAKQNPNKIVRGAFFTTSNFVREIKKDAKLANVTLFENVALPPRFPIIICKVQSGDGKRYYYCPRGKKVQAPSPIDCDRGERYCLTPQEAEENGFKRAGSI